jgi:hypothetical protein
MTKHKVFISYHHANDQYYKDSLCQLNKQYNIFIDASVDTGDINDYLSDENIRVKIRDEYLRDSTVTILLVGKETKNRKHIDWELYSSMYNGSKNKQSGILVINLPTIGEPTIVVSHFEEKNIYPEITSWKTIKTISEYQTIYPYMPDRIIDNLVNSNTKISVTNWNKINFYTLPTMIDLAFKDRGNNEYDLSGALKRRNS